MKLKPRTGPTSYCSIEPDFQQLAAHQKYYSENFINHPIFSGGNYGEELTRIQNEWKNKQPEDARNLSTDTSDIWIAYTHLKAQETLCRVMIHQLFRKIYTFIPFLLQDYEIGYLEDDLFHKYILAYKSAIDTNIQIGLDCWNKTGYSELTKIALIEKLIN